MSDNAIDGYLGRLYISDDAGATYVEVGEMVDFKQTRSRKSQDTTTHADLGEESFRMTTKSWSATCDLLYVPGDPAIAKLSAAYNAKPATKLKIRFDPNGTAAGKPRFSGDGFVESLTGPDSPTADVCKQTAAFKGTGALAEGVQ